MKCMENFALSYRFPSCTKSKNFVQCHPLFFTERNVTETQTDRTPPDSNQRFYNNHGLIIGGDQNNR